VQVVNSRVQVGRYDPSVVAQSVRDRKVEETRARITDAALTLFAGHGYAETTIDQIAEAAGVSRRTVFHHFATKDAILFDHLVVRREGMLRRLDERPSSEPALVSLHTVLREMCDEGYDRRLLVEIRSVLTNEPDSVGDRLWGDIQGFQNRVVEVLQRRVGEPQPSLEIRALARMALGWFVTAAHTYLVEGRPSLVGCFDDVVATCVEAGSRYLQ
jgi:AcrR family transcriptional regulator